MREINLTEKKFLFGKIRSTKRCFLVLRKTHSNIFLTVRDLKGRVVCCITSGASGILGNKRRKIAPQSLENIVASLDPIFAFFSITRIALVLKNRMRAHIWTLLKELAFRNIRPHAYIYFKALAHNGPRGRKIKRKHR